MVNGICILIWFCVVIVVTCLLATVSYSVYARMQGKSWKQIMKDIWDFIDGKGCL